MKKRIIRIIFALTFTYIFGICSTEKIHCLAAEESIYGEMKGGFFIKSYYEDVQSIPYEIGTPEYEAELEKVKKARYLEELTPQMKEAGYILINGTPYPGNEVDGELGEGQNIINSDEPTGYLSISTEIDDKINENCYVELAKTDDGYKIYYIKLYPTNHYSASTELPVGHYEVSGGGIENDVTSAYIASGNSFDIKEGSVSILCLKISENQITDKAGQILQQQKIEEEQALNTELQENEAKKKKTNVVSAIVSSVLLGGALTGGFLLWRKKNRESLFR